MSREESGLPLTVEKYIVVEQAQQFHHLLKYWVDALRFIHPKLCR
jgi:hypothetical protein